MKKKLIFALIIALLATLITTTPAFAFSSIQFTVYDAITLQPWAQSYRIYVWGSSGTGRTLMDTGVITAPPPLNYTCTYGGACAGTTLGTPNPGETVIIYIVLMGPVGNPSTIIKSYQQPPVGIDLGTFVINENSGTGPNAVTLAGANVESPNMWLPALAAIALVGVGGAALLLRRRRVA